MISIQDAFKKFRSRLELNGREQKDASRRQQRVRAVMDDAFSIEHDFLTGSYARWTKTKPLKDVDIFCVLGEKERHYRKKHPSVLLADVEKVLVKEYGQDNVSCQRRSVTTNFGVAEVDGDTNDQAMSFDVVPAFAKGDHYEIPDTAVSSGWTETNPRIHAEKAVKAQEAYAGEWKGLVRMMKACNRQQGKPVKPSFLLEVMALDILHPPFGGDYRREMQAFFASTAARIGETWPGPKYDESALLIAAGIVRNWIESGRQEVTIAELEATLEKHDLYLPDDAERCSTVYLVTIKAQKFDMEPDHILDWRDYFIGDPNKKGHQLEDPVAWNSRLLPQLQALEEQINKETSCRLGRARGLTRLSVWFAYGFTFSDVARYTIEVDQQGQLWRTDAHANPDFRLVFTGNNGSPDGEILDG